MPKLKLSVFVLLSFACSIRAQYYQSNYDSYPVTTLNDSAVKAMGIFEIVEDVTYIHKKHSFSHRRLYQYDQLGQSTFYCIFNDTGSPGKIQFSRFQNTPNELDYTSTGMHTSGRKSYMRIPYFNQEGKVSRILFFNEKNKISHSFEYLYKDSNMVRMNNYNSKYRLHNYYLYEYAGKKIKSTGLYNSKGKLIRFWDYSCDDEGKMVTNKSDTDKICEYKTYMSDGSIVTTRTAFGYKGKPYKTVTHRDSVGKLLKYLYYEGTNQILTYKYIYTYANGKRNSAYIWYANFKGHPYYSKYSKMDDKGKLVDETDTLLTNPKKPIIKRYTFLYDEKGLLIESSGFEGNLMTVIRRYRYSYFK